jgi:hypothetical protein
MKMISFLLLVTFSVLVSASGSSKKIYVGIVDYLGNEFNADNIGFVKYRAWLLRGSGPDVSDQEVITQNDPGNSVEMIDDIRGMCVVDLSNFETWGAGNILYVDIGDQNGG